MSSISGQTGSRSGGNNPPPKPSNPKMGTTEET